MSLVYHFNFSAFEVVCAARFRQNHVQRDLSRPSCELPIR